MSKKSLLVLFVCFAVMLALISCGDADTASITEDTVSETEGVTAEEHTLSIISSDGESYRLVRPDRSDALELDAAQLLYNYARERYGTKLDFETDYVKKDTDPNSVFPTEILIGRTNRSASEEAYSKLGENEFILAAIDRRLCVVGYTPELTLLAVEVLTDKYLTDEGLTISGDLMEIYEAEPTYTYRTFTNPVAKSGADPWVIRDGDSYYYCYSGGNGVYVNRIESIDRITSEGGTKVYTAPEGTMYSAEYWAPELHKINGKWYIYVAADGGDNYDHRMYVLECTGDDPTDKFVMKGKITDPTDKWAIDGTVLTYGGEYYFVWSGWEGDVNVAQNIYIAHMSDPWTIDSERVLLSTPEYRWEKLGGSPSINEGPVAVTAPSGKTVHIVYSASGSWSDYYRLGCLTFSGEGDILDAASWTKSDSAIFEMTDEIFGPGHCSFTTAADGSTWIVYHANLVSGSGWGGRSIWVQKVEWDGDTLVLGAPASPKTEHSLPLSGYSKDKVTKKD